MANDGATTGKPFSFNLTGDDLHLYNTARTIMEGEVETDEEKVKEALASLDPAVRAIVQSRMSTVKKENLSHRAVFVKALGAFVAAADAAEDARVAELEAAAEAGDEDAQTEITLDEQSAAA